MGVGGKSQELASLKRANVITVDIDLFKKKLIQTNALSKDKLTTMKAIINSASKLTNLSLFKALGFTSKVMSTVEQVTDNAIKHFIKNNVDYSIAFPTLWFFYPYNHLNVFDQLKSKGFQYDFSIYKIFFTEIESNGETVEVKVVMPMLIKDEKKYFVKHATVDGNNMVPLIIKKINTLYIQLSELDSDYQETDNTLDVEYVNDDRKSVHIEYITTSNELKKVLVFDSIIREAVNYEMLAITIKNNGTVLSEDSKMMIALKNLGMNYKDIKSQISSNDLKTMFFTYSTDRKDYPLFENKLKDLYDENNTVTVNILGNIFTYGLITTCKTSDNTTTCKTKYYLTIKTANENTYSISDESSFMYFIPLDFVKNLSVRDKYKFVKDCLSIIAYCETTINLKWYQSAFFQFILASLAFVTGGISGALYATIGVMATGVSSTYIKTAISLLTPYIVSNLTSTASLISTSNIITSIPNIIAHWFSFKTKNIYKQANEIYEETNKAKKEIQEYEMSRIYNPIDWTETVYDIVFDAYDYAYDYDIFFEDFTYNDKY